MYHRLTAVSMHYCHIAFSFIHHPRRRNYLLAFVRHPTEKEK